MLPVWTRSPKLTPDRFIAVALDQINSQWRLPENSDRRELALTLPQSRVLCKTLTLPLATEENLRQVLEFQLEQHTPFSPNQVYFGCAVTTRSFERGQLTVELVVTPRDTVDHAIKTLIGCGASVRAVFAEQLWAKGVLVNLLPVTLGSAPSPLRRGPNPWLAAMVGLLAVAAMAMPLIIKREAVVKLLPWVDRGKKAAEAVDSVRRELETRIEQHNFLLEKRQVTPTVIQTLEELTRVLPDDTWVQILDIKGKELQIQGETASSVRLIGLFEQSSLFREASFRSPLTKGQAGGLERYQLALQIRPALSPKPAPVAAPAQVPQRASSSPVQKVSESMPAPLSGGNKP